MDVAFSNEKDVFLVVYLDDLTIFSGSNDEHLHHLRIVFLEMQEVRDLFKLEKQYFFYGGR